MAGPEPEERVRQPAVMQSWRHVSFLHWRIDADRLAALLPDPLEPDVIDGSAWVAITPFRVDRLQIIGLPFPFSTPFAETNVRTYVRHPNGVDGLWFLSLDVSSSLNFLAGRTLAPYHLASMSVEGDDPVTYRSQRLSGRADHEIVVQPGPSMDPGPERDLAELLTGRWRAFTSLPGGRLAVVPVEHERWPLQHGSLMHLGQTLLKAAGLPDLDEDPLVHYSPGVDARIGPPRPLLAQPRSSAQSDRRPAQAP
jgi:uncharacterized protein